MVLTTEEEGVASPPALGSAGSVRLFSAVQRGRKYINMLSLIRSYRFNAHADHDARRVEEFNPWQVPMG